MIVEQQCEHCHTVFTRERKPGGREARFCSDRCRVAANRNRNRTAPIGDDVTIAQSDRSALSHDDVTFAQDDSVTISEAVTIAQPDEIVTIASSDSGVFTDPWSKVQFRTDVEYPSPSAEWFAQQRLLFTLRQGVT